MPARFTAHTQQDYRAELAENIEPPFEFLIVVTGYPVGGGYGLGRAIIKSKAVGGCGERRRFGITDEGREDRTKEHAGNTTFA